MECADKYGITLGYSLCHWYYYLCRFGNRIQKKVYKQINKFYIAVMHYGVWLLIFLRKEQMQMKLVLAEKPSVAQSIAKVLGAAKREDGYLEGNGYVVSWCVGHLVELAQPEAYDAKYSKWA